MEASFGNLISDGSADPTAFSYQYHRRLPSCLALIHSNITCISLGKADTATGKTGKEETGLKEDN